jgi:UDP-N-acetylmuramoyl-L-alanyl-D-glutamate--2,6-diaminopimelate ligase
VLDWARGVGGGRVSVVFGCGGDRDPDKRPKMGRVAALAADRVIVTSDNPRGEDPHAIIAEILRGVAAAGGGVVATPIADRAEAIAVALSEAGPRDIVIIAGKGHETTQTLRGRSEPFDDRTVAALALERLGWDGGARARA